ncbi:MAG TPA: GAF domain-containing protein [Conexibacter sp.]|nr:GAF domain-containing protein [Conexibacter sp.]
MSEALDRLVADLLAATGAGRVTLRLDVPGPAFFPVVAEACADGVAPVAGDASIDLRGAPTFTTVVEGLRTIVQDDVTTAEPPTPPEVIARYGVRAQMLAPVVRDGRCVGTLSVHETRAPRAWTAADRAALARTAAAAADHTSSL